jgi:hypothetical protein
VTAKRRSTVTKPAATIRWDGLNDENHAGHPVSLVLPWEEEARRFTFARVDGRRANQVKIVDDEPMETEALVHVLAGEDDSEGEVMLPVDHPVDLL